MMKAEYYFKQEFEHLIAALQPANRLAIELSLATGLRIGDCLALKTEQLIPRPTIKEQKTGKTRRVYIPVDILDRLIFSAGRFYAFEHRTDPKKHRTVSAVYKDLKATAKRFRLTTNVTPHSARKIFAVEQYHKDHDLLRVQRLLNHDNEAVTILYALADQMVARRRRAKKSQRDFDMINRRINALTKKAKGGGC